MANEIEKLYKLATIIDTGTYPPNYEPDYQTKLVVISWVLQDNFYVTSQDLIEAELQNNLESYFFEHYNEIETFLQARLIDKVHENLIHEPEINIETLMTTLNKLTNKNETDPASIIQYLIDNKYDGRPLNRNETVQNPSELDCERLNGRKY
jgi:hypothetical protein